MCYYNGQRVTRSEFIRLKNLEKALANYDFLNMPVQSGFDYGANAVLKKIPGEMDFEIVQMEWGFLRSDPNKWPFFKSREDVNKMRSGYTNSAGKYQPSINFLNAMGEELLLPDKVYRDAALNRRCLILSSGFFEWRHVYPIGKRTGKPLKTAVRYPYHIGLRSKEYFYLAGIYDAWTDLKTGERVETDAIVTTSANKVMEQVHNSKKRMPVILNEDLAYEWVFGNLSEERITEIATTQSPWEEMEVYPVAKDFKTALEPTAPFTYEDLEELQLT